MIAAGDRTAQQTVAQVQRRSGNHFIECETRRGLTLPWARVTLHPVLNRKMARPPFCSQVLFGEAAGIYLARYLHGAAQRPAASRPVDEGSAIRSQNLAYSLFVSFRAKRRIPDPS
jgi:hypothetical protein